MFQDFYRGDCGGFLLLEQCSSGPKKSPLTTVIYLCIYIP